MYKDSISAQDIISALGGNSETGKCLCPCHDDHKPSLQVDEKGDGKVLVYCRAGCPQHVVWDRILSIVRPFRSSRRRPITPKPKINRDTSPKDDMGWSALLRCATKSERQPIDYLRGRGIKIVPACAKLVSASNMTRLAHPKMFYPMRYPAMVVPITSAAGLLQGAQATFLDKSAKYKLAAKIPRWTYGRVSGGYVKLAEPKPDKLLVVGEEVETVLSAMQLTDLPGIALLGVGNFKSFMPPPCSEIIALADHEPSLAGLRAAEAFAKRLARAGYKVRLAQPELPKGHTKYDWNDALRDGSDFEMMRMALLDAEEVEVFRLFARNRDKRVA